LDTAWPCLYVFDLLLMANQPTLLYCYWYANDASRHKIFRLRFFIWVFLATNFCQDLIFPYDFGKKSETSK
jgi:hypothetical protein